ncbi:GAF domain-containing hybrid sensor histidine kinase/response regulator [Polaromonas glacialis]|uniref:GAF domain-containing hybrid sensor histidine kinase/response regulator n=1 Tax=Polaromonas glacialis TaxID=866564 RepID=UPI00068E7355|nr:ATP-binding protein [Polaromonas glacialis]
MIEDDLAPAMPDFLAQGGAMATRIRALDWEKTRLGVLDGWPNSLKCMLATVLGSPKPMYVLWGPEFVFFFNDAYAPMLGKHLDGAMGRPFAQVWPELWADFEPMLRQALSGQGSSYDNMALTLARHGYPEPTWWTFSFLCLRDERGAVVGVHCICIETTELVRAQAHQAFWLDLAGALRAAHTPEQLKAVAAEKLGRYLAASCVGYGEVDAAGDHGVVPQDWTAEGCPSVVGMHRLDDFGPLMAQQLRAGRTVVVHGIDQDPLTAGPAYAASYQAIECQAFINAPLVKEGRLAAIFFVLNAEPRAWAEGEQALVEEVAERTWSALQRLQVELDLRQTHEVLDHRTTELLHSENALRQSQKLDALGQLTGGVAHDVNNLLAVIGASAELLRSPGLAQDQRGQYLDRIFDTVARAAKLTGQLLAFARQQSLRPEVFDANEQVQGVLDLVRPLLGTQVEIDLQGCEEQSCLAEADINQFETSLVNLAVNARDAMDAKGRITVQVQQVDRIPAGPGRDVRPGDFVSISIRDTGVGIAADQLEAIFEPFYTTKAVGKGTGLGLSQVFGFARQSGGEIAVTSEPGQGAVFTLYLPRAEGAPAPHPRAALPEQSNAQAPGAKVLVVEDNDVLGEMTCEILAAQGYRAVWAASATAALALLGTNGSGFDLVFSDVVMPGMNGMQLGLEVRRRHPGLPVVLTSGYNAVTANEGQYGFELVLKPYTLDTLARVFGKALAGRAGQASKG